MGLIREPLDVDFVVEPHVVTKEDDRIMQEFIAKNTAKTPKKLVSKQQSKKRSKKVFA